MEGVVAATLTPFDEAGRLDLARVPAYVEFLLAGGVAGLMVGGTTGEFVAMTSDERIASMQAFVAAVGGRVPVIGHIGHASLAEACRLAERAAKAGVSGLTAITPYFYRTSPPAIAAHLREVARTAPHLPFYVYNYPEASGNPIPFPVFADLLDEPNLAGVKLSVATFAEIEPYLPLLDRTDVMSGNDALLGRFVAAGGRAVVSGNASARPSTVVAALATGALAELDALRQMTQGTPDRLKELLRRDGFDLGPARIHT